MRRCALQAEVYQALCRAGYPPDSPGRLCRLPSPAPLQAAPAPDPGDERMAAEERWSERCFDQDREHPGGWTVPLW